ncbi:MAG: alcohol dehydrogenase catalytic domain-containing protein [Acidobacteria bacterium]|nr:alcohol dehydrogenase catalytic domain-containing protein [Acidobacteriota bacterium]
MKAVHLVEPKKLEVVEVPMPPDPGPGEAMLKIRSVGICGSDLHWYLDGRIGSNICVLPQVLGHEPVAEVVAVGPGVPESRIGERVFVEPAIGCGRCEYCLTGNHNLCPTCRFLGSSPTKGLFREYGVMPAHNLIPVPAGVSDARATVAEPLAVILHILELIEMRVGDTVAVLGSGPIGMLCVAVAKLAGASKIFVADKVPHRVALGLAMGADVGIHSAAESVVDTVMDATGGRGSDVVLDAAGMIETINWGLRCTRRGGQFVLVGIPVEPELNVDLNVAMHREVRIQTIRRARHTGPTALSLIAAGRVSDAMITHRYPLERTPEAFQTLVEYADGVGKIIIEISS